MLEELKGTKKRFTINEGNGVSIYTGIVLEVHDGFIEIKDKFNQKVTLNIASIVKITEVDN